ncbi:MAG: hypothetical protein HW391_1781 [Chloroflexi bacterium]|nr:hypothetical protein [Chloroflexota bacterium]
MTPPSCTWFPATAPDADGHAPGRSSGRRLTSSEAALEENRVGVIIIREMVGTSPTSWSDAARQAVATASRTVRNIKTVEVVQSTAKVEDGEIVEYRVEIKIGFEYEG